MFQATAPVNESEAADQSPFIQDSISKWGVFQSHIKINSIVCVAYEDAWYVGKVKKVGALSANIIFYINQAPSKNYKLNARDVSWVSYKYLISLLNINPGGYILIEDSVIQDVNIIYDMYKTKYFSS